LVSAAKPAIGRKSAAMAPTIDKNRPNLAPFVANRVHNPVRFKILKDFLILLGMILGGNRP
jgi:hypothetical protein